MENMDVSTDRESSILSGSIDPSPGSTKGSKKGSMVWAHTRSAYDEENPLNKYCIYCINKIYGTNIASNMRSHLKT